MVINVLNSVTKQHSSAMCDRGNCDGRHNYRRNRA